MLKPNTLIQAVTLAAISAHLPHGGRSERDYEASFWDLSHLKEQLHVKQVLIGMDGQVNIGTPKKHEMHIAGIACAANSRSTRAHWFLEWSAGERMSLVTTHREKWVGEPVPTYTPWQEKWEHYTRTIGYLLVPTSFLSGYSNVGVGKKGIVIIVVCVCAKTFKPEHVSSAADGVDLLHNVISKASESFLAQRSFFKPTAEMAQMSAALREISDIEAERRQL
eukprot:6487496-Amphidinium_carterae.3